MSIRERFLKKFLSQTQSLYKTFTYLFLASVCAILAISFPPFWFLAPIALGLFFVDIWTARSLKDALVHGFVFGFTSGGAGIWWFWDTLPLDWMGLASAFNGWYLTFACWTSVSFVFALAVVPAAWLLWSLRDHQLRALATIPIWVCAEILRMWNFSILTYADRSLLGPHFSSASLGYPLAENHHLLQLAAGGGINFLNAVVALIGTVVALFILRDKRSSLSFKILIAALVLLLLIPFMGGSSDRTGESFDAVLISTHIPVGTRDKPDGKMYLSLLEDASKKYPSASLFVLPEETRLQGIFDSTEQHTANLAPIFGKKDVRIVSSRHKPVGRGYQASLIYENGTGETLGSYPKMFLMPAGEYMPYFLTAAFSLLPDSSVDKWMSSLPKNNEARQIGMASHPFKGHVLGGLICSDFLSPHLYRKLVVEQDVDLLINIANPAWFHNSRLLHDKTIQISKVHAVQNRAYFLQSSNGAPAFAINDSGRIIAETDWGTSGMLLVHVPGQGI